MILGGIIKSTSVKSPMLYINIRNDMSYHYRSKLKVDKIKKVYVDSRYKTNGSVSNSESMFELEEALDLPGNTLCYIDDILMKHTWFTVEQID